MPSGSGAKSILVLAGLGLLALLLAGAIVGVIGQRILGLGDGYVSKPEIHLPPQPVFPAAVRDASLGLTATKSTGDEHPEEPEKDEAHKEGEATEDDHGEEAHGTPLGITQFAVTNTLLSSWFTTVVLILFFGLGAWKKSLIPGRFQSLIEGLIEAALGFCSSVLGPEMGRKAFPVAATIFFFVLFNAWLALLPFYQFAGFLQDGEIKAHLLRSAGTDLNFPMALALISFVFVEYWGIRSHGVGYFKKFFALGALFRLKPAGLIDAFVGFLELISEFVRIVSFTFRLFGNMTAGEILVVMITFLVPFVAVEFVFGLELLVGLIQAVIFASLTLVFLSVAVSSHQEH
ncbi:MAG: ATP synthase F0 subunit A [Planctomyces sp.]|nr:ATP synthase F0 subunit A [Planctomyces sp.]